MWNMIVHNAMYAEFKFVPLLIHCFAFGIQVYIVSQFLLFLLDPVGISFLSEVNLALDILFLLTDCVHSEKDNVVIAYSRYNLDISSYVFIFR